jgi:phosphatidylethanolamine-binding protein (PEBP) family uncharacterized protein
MMVLSSSAFEDGQEIPQRHGKKIPNVSPQLSWNGAPWWTGIPSPETTCIGWW